MYEGATLKPFPRLYIPANKTFLLGVVDFTFLHSLSKQNPKG
jgi:hypothetical protein